MKIESLIKEIEKNSIQCFFSDDNVDLSNGQEVPYVVITPINNVRAVYASSKHRERCAIYQLNLLDYEETHLSNIIMILDHLNLNSDFTYEAYGQICNYLFEVKLWDLV